MSLTLGISRIFSSLFQQPWDPDFFIVGFPNFLGSPRRRRGAPKRFPVRRPGSLCSHLGESLCKVPWELQGMFCLWGVQVCSFQFFI